MKGNNTALYVKLGVGIAAAALLYVKRDEISAAVSNAFASIKGSASSPAFTPAATYAPASIAAPAAALTAPATPEATAALIADALALSKKRAAEERAKSGRPVPVAIAPKGAATAAKPLSAAKVQKVVNKINANPALARAAARAIAPASGSRFNRNVRSA
ncbi:hypothetical protein [Nevskia ramosa]|uniref:hypothetical protein n=1 Tax=Nevskia ramosa TaxID=64002 RepID=UPI0003B6CF1C|nr:hypothetical protein [Nevskia ramosa]